MYSIEKVAEKAVVLELTTTSRKFPKSFRPMEALGQDLATYVSTRFSCVLKGYMSGIVHRLAIQKFETHSDHIVLSDSFLQCLSAPYP